MGNSDKTVNFGKEYKIDDKVFQVFNYDELFEVITGNNFKNIIWDVDGVLVNIAYSYYKFLTTSKFKNIFGNFQYKELDKKLPIDKDYGAIELKTHPELGNELDKAFCESNDYYFDRPFFDGAEEMLLKLHKQNRNQFILSAGFDLEKKMKLLKQLFSKYDFIHIEAVEHDKEKGMNGNTKEAKILYLVDKYNLNKEETLLVDDRKYNISSALNAGIFACRFRSNFTIE